MEPALSQPNAHEPATVPLCELFKDLRSYSGKIVSVSGQLYSSSEVSALGAHCNDKFITKYSPSPLLPEPQFDYVWPTALDLATSTFAANEGKKLSFGTDDAAVSQVCAQIRRERAKYGNQAVETWVTVVGMVRLKDDYVIGKGSDGKMRGNGYGHLSTYPGQLVIKTMFGPVVAPTTPRTK